MFNQASVLGNWTKLAWNNLLRIDNHIIGLFICIFAILDWLTVYDGLDSFQAYFSQGFYTLPSLSILSTFFSAIYLKFAAIILLSLREPLSRYDTVLPNLVAPLAAFAVYIFVFLPRGDLLRVNLVVALILIIAGSFVVITALVFLRQAFSVTPQARFLVTSGPYSLVRHPMYVGNILSIFGVALLIDSIEAIVLFIVCAALQIGRSAYEERLLTKTFPDYANYKSRVGRFIPHLRSKCVAGSTLCLCVLLLPQPSRSEPITSLTDLPRPITGADVVTQNHQDNYWIDWLNLAPAAGNERAIIRVTAKIDAKKCTDWSRKAANGELFTANQLVEMELALALDEKTIGTAPACKVFFDLRGTCDSLVDQRDNSEIDDSAFIEKVDAARGCASITAVKVCRALKEIAKGGTRLAEKWRPFFIKCLEVEVINRRFEQIRPAM